MEISRIKILAQKGKNVHQEVELAIDWAGITTAQLYIMAELAIVRNIESQMCRGLIKEERVFVEAANFLHTTKYVPVVFDPPERRKAPITEQEESNEVVSHTMKLLLKTLTPAEIKILLGEVK